MGAYGRLSCHCTGVHFPSDISTVSVAPAKVKALHVSTTHYANATTTELPCSPVLSLLLYVALPSLKKHFASNYLPPRSAAANTVSTSIAFGTAMAVTENGGPSWLMRMWARATALVLRFSPRLSIMYYSMSHPCYYAPCRF